MLVACQALAWFFHDYTLAVVNDAVIFGTIRLGSYAIVLALMFIALIFLLSKVKKIPRYAFLILMAASISNLLERVIYGGVVDYIKIWYIPAFNLADLSLVAVIAWLIIDELSQQFKKTAS